MRRMAKAALVFLFVSAVSAWLSPSHASRRVPARVAVVINRAATMLEQGRAWEALSLLKEFKDKEGKDGGGKSEDRHGNHPMVDLLLGDCCLALGKRSEAIASYKSAVGKQPDLTAAWMNLGKCFYDAGRYEEAKSAFLKAYETPEGKGAALYYAAVCDMMEGSYELAVERFDRLKMERPGEFEPSWNKTLARLYLLADMPQKALPLLEKLASQEGGGERRMWREALVRCYASLGMDDKAADYVAHLIEENPAEPLWWKLRAWLFVRRGDYTGGLADMTVYGFQADLSREEAELAGDLGLNAGVPEQAAVYYLKAAQSGLTPSIAAKAAIAHVRMHDLPGALEWVEKGLEKGKDGELFSIKGYLLAEMGDFAGAADAYRQVASLLPDSGQAWIMLGYCLWRQGRTGEAADAFKRALRCKGYENRAKSALLELEKIEESPGR